MRARGRVGGGELAEGGAELHVDVGERRLLLLHLAELGGPRHVGGRGARDGEQAGVIEEEVEVREVPRGLDHIAWMVVVGDGAERQALVQADPLDAELARPLEHRVGDLLVVHEPAPVEALGRGARVPLPGVHLEHGGLLIHEVEVGLAELGRDEPVGQHPARLGDPVDLVADVGHLLRRHDGLLRVRARRRRDEADVGLAVEEHFLDHIGPGEVGEGALVSGQRRVEAPRVPPQPEQPHLRDALARRLVIVRVVARADIVELHVEDEERVALALPERGGLGGLHRQHVEEAPEHRVHGQQRRGHPAARAEEVAPVEPEPGRQARGLGEDAVLDPALRCRLRQRRELLVGDQASRQGHLGSEALAHVGADVEGVGVPGRHGRAASSGVSLDPDATLSTAASRA